MPKPGPARAGHPATASDWRGLRREWADRGLVISADHFGDVMAVTAGGESRSTYYSGLLQLGLELDLAALRGWRDTRAKALGIATFGRDPADGVASIHAPSNLASTPTGTLLEAWVERDFLDGRLALLGGLYAVDSEFDVKESAAVFMNGGFGTGLDLSETGLNGPCVYPAACLGLRARYSPGESGYVQFALLDGGAGDPDQPHGLQIHLRGDDGLFMIGETGLRQTDGAGRFRRAALGAWHYTTELESLLQPPAPAAMRTRDGTHGAYALVEGTLYQEPGQGNGGLSGFLRAGLAEASVNPFDRYAGAGLAYTGLLPGRNEDVLGLGISAAFFGRDYRSARALEGAPVGSHELVIELGYWMPLLPWFSVQLDAQYTRHPSGRRETGNATVLGLRYQVTF